MSHSLGGEPADSAGLPDAAASGSGTGSESLPRMRPVVDTRPADPERGLRGVMAAILILEAVTVLLGITVIQNGGASAPPLHLGILAGLAAAHVAACGLLARRFAVWVILTLQAALIACWAIAGAIGVMGIVFTLVWVAVLMMRRTFRRMVAAGQIAGRPPAPPGDEQAAQGPGGTR